MYVSIENEITEMKRETKDGVASFFLLLSNPATLVNGKMATATAQNLPSGTGVCFHGFLWSSPSTCLPVCLRPGGRGGRKQIGRQVEGFSLFGCAAAGGRAIQYK